jgi:hypothetical protein
MFLEKTYDVYRAVCTVIWGLVEHGKHGSIHACLRIENGTIVLCRR